MMLYKYRSLSTNINPEYKSGKSPKAYTLELLKNNEFYFSSPDQFNDPFDCYIPPFVLQGKSNWKKQAKVLDENYKFQDPNIKNKVMHIGTLCNFDSERIPKNAPADVHRIINNLKNKQLNDEFRIFSLSANPNHKLMWAHYANSFTGICIGFRAYTYPEDIQKSLCIMFDEICHRDEKRLPLHIKKSILCSTAIYIKDSKLPSNMATINDRFNNRTKYEIDIYNLFRRKHHDWKYEDEYRLITNINEFNLPENHPLKLKFNKDILKEIIFGLDCKPEDKEEIKEIVKTKYKQAEFYKCVKKKDEYGVDIEPDD